MKGEPNGTSVDIYSFGELIRQLFRVPKETEVPLDLTNPLHQLIYYCKKNQPEERVTIDDVLKRLDLIHHKMFNAIPDLDIFEVAQRGITTLLDKEKYQRDKVKWFDEQDTEREIQLTEQFYVDR